jgi:ABC-2 type transport system permease protein
VGKPSRPPRRTGLYRAAWLYRRCLGAHLRSTLEYEADFWIMSVTAVISQGIGVIFLWTIFRKIPLINGWRFWDVVLIYSLVVVAEGLSQLFTQGIWNLSWVVNTGDLDPILIRPYSPVLQILSSQVGMNGLGNMALGIGLLAAAVSHVSVSWPAWRIALAIVLLVSAALVKIGLNLVTSCSAFWLRTTYSMFPFSMHTLGELTRFPLTIYSTAVQLVLSIVLPFAFMSFFPATSVLGHGAPVWVGLLTPAVAAYCLFMGVWTFRLGLRRYESAGH